MSLSEDLDDYKLETEFQSRPRIVIHRSYRADWAGGRHRIVVEEKWAPQIPLLGTGSFGTVRLEIQQNGDVGAYHKSRAVKQLRKLDLNRMRIDFRKELLALTKFSRSKFVRSQAFVEFFGWFEDEEHVFLAMEYFPHGTLDKFITASLTERDAQIIALQVLEGMRIMHEERFTHRDLKPQNIFVVQKSPRWWVKIGDFGISKRVANNDTALRTSTGTPSYIAPEIFHYVPLLDDECEAYTNAVDIWSFGCVVYEMLSLQVPFFDWPKNLVAYCKGGAFPDGPLKARAVSSKAIDFVQRILTPIPSLRPTAHESLSSFWLQADIRNEYHTSEASITNSDINPSSDDTPRITLTSMSTTLTLRPKENDSVHYSEEISKTAEDLESAQDKLHQALTPNFKGMPEPVSPQLVAADEDNESALRLTLPLRCYNCQIVITREYCHCGICNDGSFNLCIACVKIGMHCTLEDHWMVKREIDSGKVTGSVREIVRTDWFRTPIAQAPPSSFTLATRRWRRSYRQSVGAPMYDYCFQCRATFPVDRPPHRHEWESHDTLDPPPPPVDKIEAKEPAPLTEKFERMVDPEVQRAHSARLKKMEEEMTFVFNQKVAEKEKNMRTSEEELYARHEEFKEQLKKKRKEVEAKIAKEKKRAETIVKPPVSKRSLFRRS